MSSFDRDAAVFLGLSQIKGIGYRTLFEMGGVAEAAHKFDRGDLDPFLWEHLNGSNEGFESALLTLGQKQISLLTTAGVHLVREDDRAYPRLFKDLPPESKPRWLFCRGNLDLLNVDSVAIVGTRDPTVVGDFLTKFAVSVAAEDHLPVVSGLAKGIDSIAHEWSLISGTPTISVLGTGILRPYPSSNIRLANEIVDRGGLLVSEYMPFAEPSAQNFVMRNRLQAALARVVVAPEWRRSSGTAHTIRFSRALGRTCINLLAEGVVASADHGDADLTFQIPRQYAAFRGSLKAALTGHHNEPPQAELFGS